VIDFFVVGCQRSGTTWLAQCLDEHPGISMVKPFCGTERKLFLKPDNDPPALACTHRLGEKACCYMERPEIPERLKQHNPRAKILVILRNPIDRAVSQYWLTRQHRLDSRDLQTALGSPGLWYDKSLAMSPFRYLERGKYVEQLPAFFKLEFDVKILVMEDVVGNIEEIYDIFEFLEAPTFVTPKSSKRIVNSGTLPDFSHCAVPKLSRTFREKLRDYYADSVGELADRYGLDLSTWERKDPGLWPAERTANVSV